MQKGIKKFYNWIRSPREIKAKENEGRCITRGHHIQDEMTIKALRRQIKLLENDLDKLSNAYFVEESMNNHIVSLTKQVNDLKIENDRARKYIALSSRDLYKTVYGRDF